MGLAGRHVARDVGEVWRDLWDEVCGSMRQQHAGKHAGWGLRESMWREMWGEVWRDMWGEVRGSMRQQHAGKHAGWGLRGGGRNRGSSGTRAGQFGNTMEQLGDHNGAVRNVNRA